MDNLQNNNYLPVNCKTYLSLLCLLSIAYCLLAMWEHARYSNACNLDDKSINTL
jgi:hypothetical protein